MKTDRSELIVQEFDNDDLIFQCMVETEDKLVEKPRIIIRGRECRHWILLRCC